jgi:hypothetical protein
MSAISLRLPQSLHDLAREAARKENVSVNQLIALALAEKLSALAAVDYLEARAQRGSRAKLDRVLAKVPDVEPELYDRL